MTDYVFDGKLSQALVSAQIKQGDRLLLRGGTYTEGDLECRLNNVTIKAYPGEVPIIKPAGGYRSLLFGSAAHDVTWDGIAIDGANVAAECIKITDGATNITIRNSELKNAPMQGVLVTDARTQGVKIHNCTIHDIGTTDLHHGIYIGDGGAIAHHNEIYNCSGHGIHAYGGHSVTEFYCNHVYDCARVGIGAYSDYSKIYNNLCERCGSNIRVRYDAKAVEIYFNTLRDALSWNLDVRSIFTDLLNAKIKNNLCVGGAAGIYFQMERVTLPLGCVELTNNLATGTALDLFIHAGDTELVTQADNIIGGDVALAKGAGVAIDGITTDYADRTRNTPPTIGAEEAK